MKKKIMKLYPKKVERQRKAACCNSIIEFISDVP